MLLEHKCLIGGCSYHIWYKESWLKAYNALFLLYQKLLFGICWHNIVYLAIMIDYLFCTQHIHIITVNINDENTENDYAISEL